MKVTWLHISDFHIRDGESYDRDEVLGALVRSVKELRVRQGRQPDLIFATGDIAQAGKASEYKHATVFFDALLAAAGLGRERLFVVPGNHDVDRDQGVGLARTLAAREEADKYFNPATPKPHLAQKLGAFRDWYNTYFAGIRELPANTTCGPVEVADIRGLRIGVLPLNSALFCQDDSDHNKLVLGRRCLGPAIENLNQLAADLKVALVHHPLDWLCDFERGNIKASLQGAVDIMLRGHLYETEVESVATPAGETLHLAAGAAYQTRMWPNRALYCTFEDRQLRVFPIRYEDNPTEVWTVDPSVFPWEPGNEKLFPVPRFTGSGTAARREPEEGPVQPTEAPRFRSNILARGDRSPFVGRDQMLMEMETALGDPNQEHVLVLHGQPGVGKSELAREFARTRRDRYPGGTFFLRTGSGQELVDLAHIGAVVLGLQFPADLSLQDQAERTLLSFGGAPVLLIYDNVVNPDDVRPWLPRAGMPCHVIITTVNERLSSEWPSLTVFPLADRVAHELIEQVAGPDVATRQGNALVKLAGGLPIELVPVARALAYEARRGRLDRAVLNVSSEAQKSFRLVYETLDTSVRLLLHAAAFLNHERIVRGELIRHLEETLHGSDVESERRLDVCADLHLLEGTDELRMHQLFASFLGGISLKSKQKTRLNRIRRRQWDRFVELGRKVAANPSDREHVSAMLTYPLDPESWGKADVRPSGKDGEYVADALIEIGGGEKARLWYERAVAEEEQSDIPEPADHMRLGRSLHQVGYCLTNVGKFEQARPWYERAITEKAQGDVDRRIDHDSLGRSLYEFGIALSKTGGFAEAQQWYERAAAELEQGNIDGQVDHTSLGRCLHQVGFCMSALGKAGEARPWYERAIAEKQQGGVVGRVDNESLGASLHEVGNCLSALGKLEEARPWYERAVAEKERGDVHGRVDHASLGRSLHQVGFCFASVGKFEEAQPWFVRAVDALAQGDVHGRMDHDSLGRCLHLVGSCLVSRGNVEEAQQWFVRAVEAMGQGDVYGRVDHESLSTSLNSVGSCFSSMGKFAEALPWYERSAAASERGDIYGRVDHESLSTSLYSVGSCFSSMGKFAEALPWYERSVAASEKGDIYGRVDNASLGASLRALASCLRKLGRLEDAKKYEAAADRLPK